MPGRGMGERLAVDPNRNSILYLGAPSGNGLWRSTDFGATWAKVTSFPNAGNYVQDPTDPNGTSATTRAWSGSPSTSARARAGKRDPDHLRRRGRQGEQRLPLTNGGTTWGAVAGQPTGYMPHKGVLDTSTASSTSPPATPAARTTAARATSGSTTRRPARGRDISPVPSTDAATTTSATAA